MKKVEVTDEWLYRYMPIVDKEIIDDLEKAANPTYKFSKRFEEKMERLIWKEKYLSFWNGKYIKKRVAIFLLIVTASLLTITISIKAYRTHFFQTIKTIHKDFFLYTYVADEEDCAFYNYPLGYLPEGYTLMEQDSNENSSMRLFSNTEGDQFTLDQFFVSNQRSIVVDSQYSSLRAVNMDGITLTIYTYENGEINAYCEYENYVFILTSDSLSQEELIKIFSGLRILK